MHNKKPYNTYHSMFYRKEFIMKKRIISMLLVSQNNLFNNPFQGMGWYTTRAAWALVGSGFTMEVTSFSVNNSYRDAVGQQFVWDVLGR